MNESERRLAEQLFQEAADLATEDRGPFLDRVAPPAEVRTEVDELLSYLHEHSVASLDEVEARSVPGLVGERIGPYRILELVGEGGYGTVYLAEQREPLERRVALKVIKLGMDTEQVIARFAAERQALARMDHPGIARVLDAGATEAGRPYFVMELVYGLPITAFCRRHDVDLEKRLRLFVRVCLAVQHAHHKGIVHRDIKPTNVLVIERDGVPEPKVIDFGIAKAMDRRGGGESLLTGREQLIGTPEYMSPEQAGVGAGDVDTRTDIYSLGVLLYELLTGDRPFDSSSLKAASHEEVQRLIREVTPPRPSLRIARADRTPGEAEERWLAPAPAHRVRGDLDWIVMKALEKDRDRRYETATALAADVQRHLDREPVLARPPSRLYQMQRFAARHRMGVITGVIATVALLAGLGLAIAGFVRAERAAAALAAERDSATENADRARRQAERARRVTALLKRVLATADPGQVLGRPYDLRSGLDTVARELENGALAGAPEAEADLHSTIGHSYAQLGHFRQALHHVRRSVALLAPTAEADPRALLDTRLLLGNLLYRLGRHEEAHDTLRDVTAALEKTRGPDDPQTLSARDLLATVHGRLGRIALARDLQKQNLDGARRVFGEDAYESLRYFRNHAAMMSRHGGRRDRVRAARTLDRVLARHRERLGERHPATLDAMNALASALVRIGRSEQAEALFRTGLASQRRILGADHPDTRLCRNNLILLLHGQDRIEESRPLVEELLAVRRRAAESPDPSARDLQRYAWALLTAVPADLRDLPRGLELAEAAAAHPDGGHPICLRTLAFASYWNGHRDRAIETLADAVALRSGAPGAALDFSESHLLRWLAERDGMPGAIRATTIIFGSRCLRLRRDRRDPKKDRSP